MNRKYKFFSGDVIKFKSRRRKKSNNKYIVMYYKVVKDPENIFTTDYELKPWEVYENTVNNCWDWNKLTKLKTKYANNIFNYYLFRLYKGLKWKIFNIE